MREIVVGARSRGEGTVGSLAYRALTSPAVVGAGIAAWIVCRNLPFMISGPDELSYWNLVRMVDPATYLAAPSNSAIQAFARLTFLIAYPFGIWAPAILRLLGALVVGGFAALLVSSRMGEAIPSRAVRVLLALSIVVLPVHSAFIQTLNAQWWIAMMVVGVALTRPRRFDAWFLAAAGLSGIAPIVALPVFRDRRAIPLLGAAVAQGLVYLAGPKGAVNLAFPASWLPLVVAVLGMMLVAQLPARTRLAFGYLGLALLLLGVTRLPTHGEDRYLTAAWVGVALGVTSISVWLYGLLRRHEVREELNHDLGRPVIGNARVGDHSVGSSIGPA